MTEEEKKEVVRKAAKILEAFTDALPGTEVSEDSSLEEQQIWALYYDGSGVWDALADEVERAEGIRDAFLVASVALLNEAASQTGDFPKLKKTLSANSPFLES